MATIVLTHHIPEPGPAILEAAGRVLVREAADPGDEDELIALLEGTDAVVSMLTDPLTARVMEACPTLKVVGNFAVGTDNIDLTAAARLGIWVTNTPGVLTDATADLTFALILAATRRVVEADRLVRAGGFDRWAPDFMLGSSLHGKRLGIIGLGRIGAAVARRAAAFGMEVGYVSRSAHPEAGTHGWKRMELDELLSTSHIVSLHLPLTEETKRLIDARALSLMRTDAFLVNTSRGEIVDEAALASALAGRRLRGAGLDVFENEPSVHPALLDLDNVVLLPHLGSATNEARTEMSKIVTTDVARALAGKPPYHPVVTPARLRTRK
jgi:glyoxylate reductase